MRDNEREVSSAMPDQFDRLLGALHGLPDVCHTKPTTIRTVTPLIGTSNVYIVQTYRQRETGDTIFLESVTKDGTVRLAIPPAVSEAIARQRDSLISRVRSKAAKAVAEQRKRGGYRSVSEEEESMSQTSAVILTIGGAALIFFGARLPGGTQPAVQPAVTTQAPYQRFIPMPRQPENLGGVPWSGALALDTKTGQLCRTYDGGVDGRWVLLSTCLDLYKGF